MRPINEAYKRGHMCERQQQRLLYTCAQTTAVHMCQAVRKGMSPHCIQVQRTKWRHVSIALS
jgi:hypothetical protein